MHSGVHLPVELVICRGTVAGLFGMSVAPSLGSLPDFGRFSRLREIRVFSSHMPLAICTFTSRSFHVSQLLFGVLGEDRVEFDLAHGGQSVLMLGAQRLWMSTMAMINGI